MVGAPVNGVIGLPLGVIMNREIAMYESTGASATPEQKTRLGKLSPEQVRAKELAGDAIEAILTNAPGDGLPATPSPSSESSIAELPWP